MNGKQFEVCPLCGGKYSFLYHLSHADIMRCVSDDCSLIFAKSQPSDEKLQEFYDTLYYVEEDKECQAEKPNSDLSKLRQHFSALDQKVDLREKKILDYGCGAGNFLEVARDAGVAEAIGVELNERARKKARMKGFRVEKTIDRYGTKVVDLVYMNDVIEHLRDPVATLRKISRILKPNGVLFTVTMNVKGLKARLLNEKWDIITDPTHFYFYNSMSLRRTLKAAGFGRVSEERFVVDFSHHGLPRRILQRVLVKFGLDTSLKMLVWIQTNRTDNSKLNH